MGLLDRWMLPVCGTGFKRKFSVKPNMMLSWTVFVLLAVVRPVFCEVSSTITVEYYVQEEQPKGTVVATVKPDGAPPPYITFSDGIGSGVENVLSLSEDGLITVTGRLDREQHSLFKLLAISTFSSKHISIIIHVTDINDNNPTFPHSVITKNLLESTPKNAKYPLGSILDPDFGINSTQRYEIAEGNVNGAFRLKTMQVPNRNGILYLDLIINQKLDYETIPLYNLLIKAYDGGTPPNVGSMRVVVNVIDANDNQPIFNISRYYARVAENATTGATVLQVFATDRDSGENGRIRYHIDRDRSDPLENFEINPLSGSITVNKKLDYEEKRAYELIVVARDNGTQKLQTTAVVSVQILDINDNKPVIDLKFLTNNGKGHITESAQPGDFVARISVSDPDVKHGVVGVNVTLSGGDGHFGLTTRNSIVYLVILSKSLDREHRPAYTLTVTAVDSGTPPLTSRKTFTIYVTDTNDNAPMFAQSVYYADIQEIVPPGSSVIQLVAIDGDYGNNSVIRYTILADVSSHAEWFQIDNHTGLITTKARVDCETASEPRLIVKAMDTGTPPMSANATVIVRIRDVNDNQPVFHQSFYNVSVFENATVGSCIMKVTAYDPDCGANAQVHYSIPTKDGFHYPTGLQVDSDSGEICITEPLDYETRRTYDFPVVATDKDALHTTAMVKVTVRDINDNQPQFYPTAYQVSIHRDAAVASTIAVVKATDKDSRAAGHISYSIVRGNIGGVFSLDSTTGVIMLKKGLSSSPSVYTLVVSAVDGGGLVSLTNATVTISVLTVGQNVPQFTQLLYRFEVSENARTGTPVGTVGVARESAAGAEVSYFITSGDPHSYMAIDSKTGQIRTAKTLDHETDPTLLLSVQAKSGSPPSFLTAQVNISVTDFNDNAPQFSVSQMEIPVSENTPLSSTIYVVDAHDADSGDNGRVRYSLANSSNLFVIDSQSGCIKLRRKLDYEQRTQHKFVVIATDSGRPTKKSTMDVTINVQDVNDNAPVFSKMAYEFRVSESVRPNTKFAQPRADDADSGNNARVTYLIHNGANLNIFGIFPSDGYLYTKTALDHEVQDHYDLRIVAIDNGIPAMSTTVPVTIRILDVNDNGPAFDKASYTFHVTENRPPHSVVGFVTASDSDTSDTLHYQLIDKRGSFIVSETSGEIITRVALNRESQETYRLTVHVSDQGEPPNTATVEVEVTVDDVNDNNPVFDRAGHYRVEVKENQPEGTLVTQVSARDGDKGENGTVSYYFSQADDNHDSKMFSINSVTGRITTREVLDHEMKSQYMLRVIARDGGSPARETEKLIEVTVDDINETPPRFETSHVAFSVHENTNPGTTVGQVKATDSDSGENGRVLYYIVRGNPLGSFGVDMKTGVVFVAKPVDYEEWSAYSMQIQAIDSSVVNPLSSIIEVNITVIDEDDNLPVFSEDPVVVSIRENIPVGVDIYDISATDADSGKWGEIRYSIESQSPDRGHLRINRRTGTLTIAKVIDYEETRKVSLVVRASNPSKESEFSTGTVVMLIEDVNDNAPEFKMRMRADIMEDEAVGYPILHVIAVDADSHDNGKLTYLIVSGNEMENFKLNSETGLLSIAKTLDREATEVFRLNISAADRGQPQHTTYAALAVHVIDVNDNPPVFERSVYVVNVSEGLTLGSVITTVHAVDKDTGVNAELNYLIPVGDDHFTIDLKSGEITTNTVLDREQQDNWVITAYVKDGAFPALYDTATVMLNVLDENDNAPVFKNHFYHLSVPENANMAVIHTIMASDADTGSYGHVTFSIVGGSKHSLFAIDRETGRLSCKPLDREEAAFHNLTIEARDGGTPPLVATAMIFIDVIDDNDNDPEFTQRAYATSILENVRVGQSVLTVEASDLDLGENARITYSIHNPTNGKFKINNVTGVIMTAGEFDREKKSSYSFEVSATDGGLYGPRSDQVRVDITILDVNDNAPVFEKIPYTVDIAQNHAIGQYVTQVQADDKDDGDNGKVLYTFEKRNQYFSIDADSGFIKVKSLLDATAVMMHRIRVIARDHGVAPRSSTGVVEVIVGNAPGVGTLRFTNLTYNVYLTENAKAGTPVVQVEAKFATGGPGPIAYSFASGNEDLTFNIHSDRGYVSVSDPAKLDYENHHRLRLIVVATANNAYGYTTVWVNLRDANDNAPHFTQDRYTSSVWEGNSRGTYVTQVIATDVDEGRNARIMYTIISGNTHNAFVIDPPNTGIVKTNVILDREIVDSYRLEVEAVDQGATPLTSTCILRIQIIDDNDNAPFFPSYRDVKVREGTELGTIVKQVTANDVDLNPILTYDFATNGNPEDAFSIDRYSGKIAIAKPLDYERMPRYQLRIQASDKKHTATMRMVIKILDENDNSPEFSQQSYQVTLAEMTGPHYSVVTLNATDRDAGENARVTYSMLLVDGFYINSQTGTIYTNKTVAFNPSQPTIHLVVTAKDHGNPSLSAVIAVRVQVIDINNHAPVFIQAIYSGSVRENNTRGSTILTVSATDADDSYENKKIDYSIVSGNHEHVFEISPNTGELILTGELDRERTSSYSMVVRATDRGDRPLNSTAVVNIEVEDVNDNSPVFNLREYHVKVNESVTTATRIIRLLAADKDAGENGRVQYTIASGNDDGSFDINIDTGYISVGLPLDHETRDIHRLIIRAIDSSVDSPRQSAFTTVIVNVTDVNEYPPRFPVMMYLESVLENESVGLYVFTAHANDQDGGIYGVVQYELINEKGLFVINRETGDVTTAAQFDYESINSYQFKVNATDRGGRFTTIPVMVNIEAKDEFKPHFVKTKYSFSVPGNAKKGHYVGKVHAGDKDDDYSAKIRYHFREPSEYFEVNQTDGIIFVKKDLQDTDENEPSSRQRRDVYSRQRRALEKDVVSLNIVASSGSPNAREDEAEIKMEVDRTCPGCSLNQPVTQSERGNLTLSGTPLVLLIVFAIIAIILIMVIVVMYIRGRDRKRRLAESIATGCDSSFEALPPPPMRHLAPPAYNETQNYHHNVTTSDVSDQSHSASSGRGSAEYDEDEEIRMINATPMQIQSRVPDSGIQPDDDAASDHSAQNHQQYLANLGIDSSRIPGKPAPDSMTATSVESMHQFSDEGGGEGDGLEAKNLMYPKGSRPAPVPKHVAIKTAHDFGGYIGGTEPSNAGSLSSIINSEEEFSGSYNWDYLLDWGPQYQPLAHVFSEIARLKDDSIKPKKQPTKIIMQQGPKSSLVNTAALQSRARPPPIITDAPPHPSSLPQPIKNPSQLSMHSNSSNSNSVNSARTSQLTSLSGLPKSPISYESTFTSPAMSPSFTPSLSPLARRSPSISPLVTPRGIGSSGQSSGQTTPHRTGGPNTRHHRGLGGGGSSGSEQEIRI